MNAAKKTTKPKSDHPQHQPLALEKRATTTAQARIVSAYLEAVSRPRPTAIMDARRERAQARIDELVEANRTATAMDRLKNFRSIRKQQEIVDNNSASEMSEEEFELLEQKFKDVALEYSESSGFVYSDFRAVGVTGKVLIDAGFTYQLDGRVAANEARKRQQNGDS